MKTNNAGAGGMPEESPLESGVAANEQTENMQFSDNSPLETENSGASRQPDFRVVQPEFDPHENKTNFKDVGAIWKNISQKSGKEFYTLKIGKLRLLVFPNQKLVQ